MNNKRAIGKSFLLLFCLLCPFLAHSQYPLATGSPHGIYIFLDNRIPVNSGYKISRSEDKRDNFQSLGSVEAPRSMEELKERILKYQPLFIDLGSYSDADIKRMWDYISKYPVIDTLPPANYPVMHLAAGTAFLDQTAVEGINYKYRIENPAGEGKERSKTTNVVSYPFYPKLPMPKFNAANPSPNNIYADWWVNADPLLYSFRVYRRQNMAGEFLKLETERGFYNRGDSLFLVVNDRSVRPRTVYEYYIEPLDRLGNSGKPSEVSMITSFVQNDVPVLTRFNVGQGSEDHETLLTWKLSDPGLVRSVSVFRSDNYDSAYIKVAELSHLDTTYLDHVPGAMENYYYYLVLQGIMNKSYPSAKVAGHASNKKAPEPPENFAVLTIDGGVKVYWNHLDPTVIGYYVYRDEGVNGELSQLSGLISATGELVAYIDTSRGLRGNLSYRYAVKAVSDGYLLSALSEIATARPGIKTISLPPSNLRGGFAQGKVLLVWDDMYRENEFLLGYKVYRKKEGEAEFSAITEEMLLFNENTFADSLIERGAIYNYAVSAVDESGTESLLSSLYEIIIPVEPGKVIPPYGLRVTRSAKGIELSWPADEDSNNSIRVYRYVAGQEAQKIADIPAGNFSYLDNTVQKGALYFYYLRAVNPEGEESGPSEVEGGGIRKFELEGAVIRMKPSAPSPWNSN